MAPKDFPYKGSRGTPPSQGINLTRKSTTPTVCSKESPSKSTLSQTPTSSGTAPKRSGRVVPAPIQSNPAPLSSEVSRTTSTSPTLVNSGPPSGKSSEGYSKAFDSTNEHHLALRPSFGTKGTPTKILMNYTGLESTIKQPIFIYSIAFKNGPNYATSDKLRRLMELFLEEPVLEGIGPIATDFETMFLTARVLQFDEDFKKLNGVDVGPVYYYTERDKKPDETRAGSRYEVEISLKRKVSVSELSRHLSSIHGRTESPMDDTSPTHALGILTGLGSSKLGPCIFASANRGSFSDWLAGSSTGGMGLDSQGFCSSVRTSTLRMLVNPLNDTSTFCYPEGSLSRLIAAYEECFERSPDQLPPGDLQSFLSGLKVSYSYLKDKFTKKPVTKFRKIRGIAPSKKGSEEVTFNVDGRKTTVKEHFNSNSFQSKACKTPLTGTPDQGIDIKAPSLPVVDLSLGDEPCWVPPELCTVLPNQMYGPKLPGDRKREMMNFAMGNLSPSDSNKMSAALENLGFSRKQGTLASFGLRIDPGGLTTNSDILMVNGRTMPMPRLSCDGTRLATPSNGEWNLRSMQFQDAKHMPRWAVLKAGVDPSYNPPVDELIQCLQDCGIRMQDHPAPKKYHVDPSNAITLEQELQSIAHRGIRLLWVIMPTNDAKMYARIKSVADANGIHTVCSVENKLMDVKKNTDENKKMTLKLKQICTNLAMKVNLKSGGVNWTLLDKPDHLRGKTMIIGIDVAHPPSGCADNAPSVAAVVANIDDTFAQWPASLRTQAIAGEKTESYDKRIRAFERKNQTAPKDPKSRCKVGQNSKQRVRQVPKLPNNDIVNDLPNMVLERLQLFKTHKNNELPTKILIYRSGLPSTQYTTIPRKELGAIQHVCKLLYERHNQSQPKTTYIVCGNGHHTRFRPAPDGAIDNDYSKSGTVVDRAVTMERGWDFFLAAQAGNMGTAKPTHYTVIQDGIGIGVDEIERITNDLRYLAGRVTRSVSLCAPAYYADLACARAKCHLYDVYHPTPTTQVSQQWSINVHDRLKDTMFYV